MRKWLLAIITIITITISAVKIVYADSPVTISYRFLNTTETETATIATMEVEIVNNNAFDLNNLNVTLTSPAAGGIQGSAEIKGIPSNGTGSVTGVFTAPRGLLDMEPLFFEITYTDNNGQQQKAIIQGTKR